MGAPAGRARSLLDPLELFDHGEVSAKAGANVEGVFEMIVAKIVHPDRQFISGAGGKEDL